MRACNESSSAEFSCVVSRLISPTASCTACSGTGLRTPDAEKCTTCRGAGITKCRKCDGSGRIVCAKCKGYGALACSHCQGAAEVTRYPQGSVTQSLKKDVVSTPETDESNFAATLSGSTDYQVIGLTQELVETLPETLKDFLYGEVEKPPKGNEIARSAKLELL